MIAESLHGNNRLIRKTILRMYPGIFVANLTTNVTLMVDTLLAGAFLGQQAIAAIAIALPAIGIFQALIQSVIRGSAIKMAVHAGGAISRNSTAAATETASCKRSRKASSWICSSYWSGNHPAPCPAFHGPAL